MDKEVSDFYFQVYPQIPNSKVAFSAEYSKFYELITNDYGQGKYKQITISENPVMIAAFAISACIAIMGGFATLWILFLSLKGLRRQYQLYLTKQTQLAITIKQQKLSNDEVELDNQKMLEEF